MISTDFVYSARSRPVPVPEDWLRDSKKQLDIPEQEALMHVIGLRSSDLPEVLVHDFRSGALGRISLEEPAAIFVPAAPSE